MKRYDSIIVYYILVICNELYCNCYALEMINFILSKPQIYYLSNLANCNGVPFVIYSGGTQDH